MKKNNMKFFGILFLILQFVTLGIFAHTQQLKHILQKC